MESLHKCQPIVLASFGCNLWISQSCQLRIQNWMCPYDKKLSGFQIVVCSVACLEHIWIVFFHSLAVEESKVAL